MFGVLYGVYMMIVMMMRMMKWSRLNIMKLMLIKR